ncbi:MAG: LegC family aminotransferase [Erysipelotrichales bacterium]|nr:LegC family aminotransferase [Erysipelotrichales bacterium]
MKNIPLSIPNVCGNEVKYVSETLADGWISAVGPYVSKFENAMKEYIGSNGAVAVASGSAALHLAYLEAGVGLGDVVLVPALTFIASVNPVAYLKAEPYFIDVDDTLCMDPVKLEAFLTNKCLFENGIVKIKENNKRVKAICVVDIFGNLADYERINEIASKYNLVVIEDAAEAVGSYQIKSDGTKQYAGTFTDYGCFSFNGNKIMSTGGGGMVFAKDTEHLEHIRFLSTQAKSNAWYFYHDEVGFNYRLSNTAAAIGVAQLENLENFVKQKHILYDTYKAIFEKNGIEMLSFRDNIRANKWFFSILWNEDNKLSRDELMAKLKERGIETRPVWGLINEQKPYQNCGHDDLERTYYYKNKIVNIPCSTNLTVEDAEYVANEIIKLKNGE